MVSGEGIEPSANRLKVYCSTAELPTIAKKMARHTAPFFVYRNSPALFEENASLQAKTVCKLRSDNSLHLSQPVFSRKNRPVSSYGLQKPACRAKPLFHRHVKEGKIVGKAGTEPVKNLQDQPRGKRKTNGNARFHRYGSKHSAEISVAKPHAYAGLEWRGAPVVMLPTVK